MKIIGLTGSVGSGKSTVGKWMEQYFPVKLVMTDEVAHKAYEPGNSCYVQLLQEYGEEILAEDRTIDRKKLATIVFSDEKKIKRLNAMIHPWVKEYLAEDIQKEKKAEKYGWYVIESAILFQTGLDKMCEECWFVDTKDSIRRERLKSSRGYTDEKVDAILEQQKENDSWKKHCEVVIENNEGEQEIVEKLKVILV